jgi:small subunit ribosomal protein S6
LTIFGNKDRKKQISPYKARKTGRTYSMRHYETIYIVNPNLDADSLNEVVTKFSDLSKKLKAYIVKVSEWGKRKLAYEVKRFDKGYYIVIDFCGLPEMVKELERNLKLDDRVLKYITVKIDEDVDPEDLIGKEREKEDIKRES